ncbi:MAG: hypothetical protein A2Y21_08960 [Clostridiales bacterium GWC2_40_7]|nr:MAG: hypothetical protein A2Y21_08960 [Clostridiales bacterium GWC2_40_7]
MRNLKKFVAFIVTIAMIATFAIPAFAAAPADVVGTDYEGAVTRLQALGVINGYPDGDFGPNDTITRAQFAAVVVRALGYEEVAETAKGATKFSDVAATNWASGYINLAVSLGIIKGNPDGSFAPDASVLYEQAVTMIVRALGQEAFAEKKGGYPSGYLVQAKVIGFTDDVKGVSGTAATRGIVALLIDNAKAETIFEQTGFGDSQTYEETSPAENFLTRLGMSVRTGGNDVIVTETPESTGLDANDFKVTGDKTFTAIAGAVDIEALLGKKVDVWGSADDEVVLVEVVTGTKVAVKSVDEVVYEDGDTTVSVTLADDTEKEYTIVDNGAAIETFEAAVIEDLVDDLEALDADEYQTSFVVDGDDLLFVDAVIFDVDKEASAFTENKVAEWIKLSGYYIKRNGDDIKKLVIVKDGETVDYTAIKDDDILFVAENMGTDADDCNDDRLYIKATSKTVEGTLQAAKPNLGHAEDIKVEGTWYDVSAFKLPAGLDVSENIGGEITLTLDPAGKAYSIDGEEVESEDKFGVVLGNQYTAATAIDDAVYKVKILTSAGDEVIYTVDEDVEAVQVANTALEGKLARYTLDSDAVIDSMEIAADLSPVLVREIDTDRFEFGSYDMDSDVVFFTADDAVALADIEDDTDAVAAAILRADPDDDTSDIVAILFGTTALIPNGYDAASTDDNYGYIADFVVTDEDEYSVDVITKDGAKTYTYESDDAPVIGDFVVFSLDADNNMTDVLAAETSVEADLTITDVTTAKITAVDASDDEDDFWFADDAIIVSDDTPTTSGAEILANDDLYEDMVVTLYLDDSGDVMLVVVTDM